MENWKAVVGYDGLYEVSNFGRLRSLDRLSTTGRQLKGKMMKPHTNKLGYMRASLGGLNPRKHQIHRLVVTAFIGAIPEGLVIDHIDSNPSNNNLKNLEVVTYHENMVRGKLCTMAESKYVGVVRNKSNWSAKRSIDGETFFLGTYKTEQDASEAYQLGKETGKKIIKPKKGYCFNKKNQKFMIEVMGIYYGYVQTETEAVKKVAEIRKGLQNTMIKQ
tara:strand:- start:21553 stop:22206 length:654 start_codon:yes stop_codon:yes gene_type:complete